MCSRCRGTSERALWPNCRIIKHHDRRPAAVMRSHQRPRHNQHKQNSNSTIANKWDYYIPTFTVIYLLLPITYIRMYFFLNLLSMEMIVQKVSANQTPVTVTELVESAIKNTFKQVIRCKFLHLASQPRF